MTVVGKKNKNKTHFWLHKMAVSNSFMVCSWPDGDECGSHMDFTAIGGWTGDAGAVWLSAPD